MLRYWTLQEIAVLSPKWIVYFNYIGRPVLCRITKQGSFYWSVEPMPVRIDTVKFIIVPKENCQMWHEPL